MKTRLATCLLALTALSAYGKNVIVDVRTPEEYATGHIAGAINIEYTSIAQGVAKSGISKDDTVILYCRSGRRSSIALDTLKAQGFSKAQNAGGLDEARKALEKK